MDFQDFYKFPGKFGCVSLPPVLRENVQAECRGMMRLPCPSGAALGVRGQVPLAFDAQSVEGTNTRDAKNDLFDSIA